MQLIKSNKAKCLLCGDVLISREEDPSKIHICSCGNLSIFGGISYIGRKARDASKVQDMVKLSFDDCPEVNTNIPKMIPPGSTYTKDQN